MNLVKKNDHNCSFRQTYLNNMIKQKDSVGMETAQKLTYS